MPAVVLAVRAPEVARPLALVTAVLPPLMVAEAPEPGGVKVTVAPEIGLPLASVTRATSGLVKAAPTVADCPEPDETAVVLAAPAVMLKALALVGAVRAGVEVAVRV